MINFSINGSGICTTDLSSVSNESEANCEPPMPSRPVGPPIRTTKSPLLAWFFINLFFLPNPIAATSTNA